MDECCDRLAIIDLINRFGVHTDWREWDSLRSLFKDEIRIDYTSLNGGKPSTVKTNDLVTQWQNILGHLEATQHMITNHIIELDSDRATCRAHVRAQHVLSNRNGGSHWMPSGTYLFELEKIDQNWKISSLTLKMLWAEGNQNLLTLAKQKNGQT